MSSEHDLDAIPSQLGDGVSDDPPQQDNPTPAEYVRTVLRSTRRAEGDPFMARVTQFGQPRLPSAADAAANPEGDRSANEVVKRRRVEMQGVGRTRAGARMQNRRDTAIQLALRRYGSPSQTIAAEQPDMAIRIVRDRIGRRRFMMGYELHHRLWNPIDTTSGLPFTPGTTNGETFSYVMGDPEIGLQQEVDHLAHYVYAKWPRYGAPPHAQWPNAKMVIRIQSLKERTRADGGVEYDTFDVVLRGQECSNIVFPSPASIKSALDCFTRQIRAQNEKAQSDGDHGSGWRLLGVNSIILDLFESQQRVGVGTPILIKHFPKVQGVWNANPHPKHPHACVVQAILACFYSDDRKLGRNYKRDLHKSWRLNEAGNVEITKPERYQPGFPTTLIMPTGHFENCPVTDEFVKQFNLLNENIHVEVVFYGENVTDADTGAFRWIVPGPSQALEFMGTICFSRQLESRDDDDVELEDEIEEIFHAVALRGTAFENLRKGKATHAPLCCRKCYSFRTFSKEALKDHVASQCEQGSVVKYIDGELENLPATERDQMQIIMGADFETHDDHPKLSILNKVQERLHQAREHLKVLMESAPMDESSPSAPEVEPGNVGSEGVEFDDGFVVEDGDHLPEAHQQQLAEAVAGVGSAASRIDPDTLDIDHTADEELLEQDCAEYNELTDLYHYIDRLKEVERRCMERASGTSYIPNSFVLTMLDVRGSLLDIETCDPLPEDGRHPVHTELMETMDPLEIPAKLLTTALNAMRRWREKVFQRNRALSRAVIDDPTVQLQIEAMKVAAQDALKALLDSLEEKRCQLSAARFEKECPTYPEIKKAVDDGWYLCPGCKKPHKALVRDHCHVTEEFRELLCWLCNIKKRCRPTGLCFFHNGERFDFIFIMELLLTVGADVLKELAFAERRGGKLHRYGFKMSRVLGNPRTQREITIGCYEIHSVTVCSATLADGRRCSKSVVNGRDRCSNHAEEPLHADELQDVRDEMGNEPHFQLVFRDSKKYNKASLAKITSGNTPQRIHRFRELAQIREELGDCMVGGKVNVGYEDLRARGVRALPGEHSAKFQRFCRIADQIDMCYPEGHAYSEGVLPPDMISDLEKRFPVTAQAIRSGYPAKMYPVLLNLLTQKNLFPYCLNQNRRTHVCRASVEGKRCSNTADDADLCVEHGDENAVYARTTRSPYTLFEWWNTHEFPPFEAFHNLVSPVSRDDYEKARRHVWEPLERLYRVHLDRQLYGHEYQRIYQEIDGTLELDFLAAFQQSGLAVGGFDPLNHGSIGRIAFERLIKYLRTDGKDTWMLPTPPDEEDQDKRGEIVRTLREHMHGGFVLAARRRLQSNAPEFEDRILLKRMTPQQEAHFRKYPDHYGRDDWIEITEGMELPAGMYNVNAVRYDGDIIRLHYQDFSSLYPSTAEQYMVPCEFGPEIGPEECQALHEQMLGCEKLEDLNDPEQVGLMAVVEVAYTCIEHPRGDIQCHACSYMRKQNDVMPVFPQPREIKMSELTRAQQHELIVCPLHENKDDDCGRCTLSGNIACETHRDAQGSFNCECPVCNEQLNDFVLGPRAECFSSNKLVADLLPKRVLAFGPELKYYVERGLVRIVRFVHGWTYKQSWDVRDFFDALTKQRREAKDAGNDALQEMIKLIMNSCAGFTMMDPLRYNQKIDIFGVGQPPITHEEVRKRQSRAHWQDRVTIGNAEFFIHSKKEVKEGLPLHIGVFIYSLSKLEMRRFIDLLFDYFGVDNVDIAMTDTDSLVYSVNETRSGKTMITFIREHPDWFVLSTYPTWHDAYSKDFPKRCLTFQRPDGSFTSNHEEGAVSACHGTVEEENKPGSCLGFCQTHLDEMADCLHCVNPPEKCCGEHRWTRNKCDDCDEAAREWAHVPSMLYAQDTATQKVYLQYLFDGFAPDGSRITVQRGKAKGSTKTAQKKAFAQFSQGARAVVVDQSSIQVAGGYAKGMSGAAPATMRGHTASRIAINVGPGAKGKMVEVPCPKHSGCMPGCKRCQEDDLYEMTGMRLRVTSIINDPSDPYAGLDAEEFAREHELSAFDPCCPACTKAHKPF
eukprot:CAMPEP_0206303696 /NCGR_PEP_ID=MMETSP0106_2-20121207/9365_1 /ASSEMBLY_ACC=CAM_ASM_000206 /TAXON_ID=81532 /ORGANISM="Acanthoeca-like sp., Strain 10tr" /LENGTH=2053 /DNA_ID=CAMNT_0053734489 /DNA_START=1091 /DNA_END=7249 /DNA_ORIENTATION=-